jgi:hypothetical protein
VYSYEIEELLKIRNNLVSIREYMNICSSPQVNHIFYENDEFTIWTTDNYKFVLKIKKDH